jgi:uroporphyrinogen decarboxylase
MNSRERIKRLISGESADRCGFWLGNPWPESMQRYHRYFNTRTEEELRQKLGDDFRWIHPQRFESTYQHPQGQPLFKEGLDKKSHGQAGPFADCESVAEVDAYEWPNTDYLDFDEVISALENAGEVYRAGGFWTPFYHHLMDLFGMEAYLIKMYTHPEVVHAVTDRVCNFYYQANEMLYEKAGTLIDAYFFGNDFGTQLDLIMAPSLFDQFVMPWFAKFTRQAHEHGYQVILHSCGSIFKVIERLIDAGVDCLHPLQAKAANMDAETLAAHFKGRIAFLGGIDTQEILVHATPEEVEEEVRRVRSLLGPNLIISPSHEALLPNVPPQNVEAMAKGNANKNAD